MTEIVRLAEVAEIKHGYAFSGKYFSDTAPGDRLVTPGNFQVGGGWQDGKPKYYQGPPVAGFTLSEGDVVVTMTDLSKAGDTLGYSARVPAGGPYLHNQRIGLVRVTQPSRVDTAYLSYLLRSPRYRQHVLASATGSTVRHTSPGRILDFTFEVPPLEEQRVIAELLRTLDDKIGANTRTAASARRLVEAMFASAFEVRGAERTRLGELADVVDCLHSRKPEPAEGSEYRYLVLKDIRDDGRIEPVPNFTISHADYADWTRRIEVTAGDCVITNVGRVGAVGQLPAGVTAAVGRNMTAIRGRAHCPAAYLVEALRCSSARGEIEAKTDHGTVLAALNVRTLPDLFLPAGSFEERAAFAVQAAPLHALQDAMLAENLCLAALRNALLSPLMSGELRLATAPSLAGEAV